MNIRYLLVFVAILIFGCTNTKNMIDKKTVKELDLNKYLGKWYEIARFDHRFERGLVGVSANYSMRNDGKIRVVNSGYKGSLDGKFSEAIGKAKIPNNDDPAKLKVSFFWFFYGDYFVLEIDKNYKWAIVGSSSDNYLWILSRTPQMNDVLYNKILEKLKIRGYDTSKIIKVIQHKN
jgi:lipocalin